MYDLRDLNRDVKELLEGIVEAVGPEKVTEALDKIKIRKAEEAASKALSDNNPLKTLLDQVVIDIYEKLSSMDPCQSPSDPKSK
jgi:hypothetical protein